VKFGHSPAVVFEAARGHTYHQRTLDRIWEAISSIHQVDNMYDTLLSGGEVPYHSMFEINPQADSHTESYENISVQPVSKWVVMQLYERLGARRKQGASSRKLLQELNSLSRPMAACLWETRVICRIVHKHNGLFSDTSPPRVMRQLPTDDTTHRHFQEVALDFGNPDVHMCSTLDDFLHYLHAYYHKGKSCFLYPNWATLPTLKPILFRPGHPVTVFQISFGPWQKLNVSDIAYARWCFSTSADWFSAEDKAGFQSFCPEYTPWQIVFIVPNENVAEMYYCIPQRFENSHNLDVNGVTRSKTMSCDTEAVSKAVAEWQGNTTQWVHVV
jgi:hypothetical protein